MCKILRQLDLEFGHKLSGGNAMIKTVSSSVTPIKVPTADALSGEQPVVFRFSQAAILWWHTVVEQQSKIRDQATLFCEVAVAEKSGINC